MTANDKQVGGEHYKTGGGTEYWDLCDTGTLAWYGGRYVARWRKKGGVQDLEKSIHVFQKIKEVGDYTKIRINDDRLALWMPNSGLTWVEKSILTFVFYANRDEDIDDAIAGIEHLIKEAKAETELKASEYMLLPKDHLVVDKNGQRLKIGDACTFMPDDKTRHHTAIDVLVEQLLPNNTAIVDNKKTGPRLIYAKGSELRLSKSSESAPPQRFCSVCTLRIEEDEGAIRDQHGNFTCEKCTNGEVGSRWLTQNKDDQPEVTDTSMEPWRIVDKNYRNVFSEGSAQQRVVFDKWWSTPQLGVFQLRPLVHTREGIPVKLHKYYQRHNSELCVLRIELVPERVKEICDYPNLFKELSKEGFDRLDEEWKFAYHREINQVHYTLSSRFSAWAK